MRRLGSSVGRTATRVALAAVATATAALLVLPSAVATPETDAADAIERAWSAAGGADSPVGGQDGDVYQAGAGYVRKFASGKIFFTPDTGAHLLYGAILDKYESVGGPGDSDLGFPTIDEVPGLVGPDSRVSTFSASDKPAIFWTPDTGAWAVRGAINAAWDKLGGSAGTLGVPVEDERYDGDVVSQKFTGGELSWNSATKAFSTTPAELADTLTGLEVPLDPTTMINQAWRAAGGLGGPLGARQGDQTPIGDGGAAQGYAGGKIFYTPETGAHALTGAILSKYEALDGPAGDLGLPIGVETDGGVPNSRVSAFSGPDQPVIFWTPDSGAIVVRGAINAAWQKLGAGGGKLGGPAGEQSVSGDTVAQRFSGGEIAWNDATKKFSTTPGELAGELNGLELPDAVAQTPSGGSGDEAAAGGWRWWWLAIIVPLVLLLGLLALWATRRSGSAHRRDEHFGDHSDDRESGRAGGYGVEFGANRSADEADGPHWPAEETAGGSGAGWSVSQGGPEFDADEDAIDTAPTRVATETDLAGFGDRPVGLAGSDDAASTEEPRWTMDFDSGRHSRSQAESGLPQWQFDLDEGDRPRHRRAAEESAGWTREVGAEEVDRAGQHTDTPATTEPAISRASEQEPWRPAIHLPLADPYQAPEGYIIKATTHSGLYYLPDSALYENTLPEVWFASEDVAQANGFVRAPE